MWQNNCIKNTNRDISLPLGNFCRYGVFMNNSVYCLLFSALCTCLVSGCNNVNYPVQTKPENVMTVPTGNVNRYDDLDYKGLELNAIVSRMADQLERYRVPHTGDLPGLAIVTFVDVHSYKYPSELGRVIAEDFIHEMHRRGEAVIDHHLTGYVEVTKNGDIVLSRDAHQLARKLSISRFLIGTVARNKEGYVVNARIVSLKNDNMVESTAVGMVPHSLVPPLARPVVIKSNPSQTRMSGGLLVREDPSMAGSKQTSIK